MFASAIACVRLSARLPSGRAALVATPAQSCLRVVRPGMQRRDGGLNLGGAPLYRRAQGLPRWPAAPGGRGLGSSRCTIDPAVSNRAGARARCRRSQLHGSFGWRPIGKDVPGYCVESRQRKVARLAPGVSPLLHQTQLCFLLFRIVEDKGDRRVYTFRSYWSTHLLLNARRE